MAANDPDPTELQSSEPTMGMPAPGPPALMLSNDHVRRSTSRGPKNHNGEDSTAATNSRNASSGVDHGEERLFPLLDPPKLVNDGTTEAGSSPMTAVSPVGEPSIMVDWHNGLPTETSTLLDQPRNEDRRSFTPAIHWGPDQQSRGTSVPRMTPHVATLPTRLEFQQVARNILDGHRREEFEAIFIQLLSDFVAIGEEIYRRYGASRDNFIYKFEALRRVGDTMARVKTPSQYWMEMVGELVVKEADSFSFERPFLLQTGFEGFASQALNLSSDTISISQARSSEAISMPTIVPDSTQQTPIRTPIRQSAPIDEFSSAESNATPTALHAPSRAVFDAFLAPASPAKIEDRSSSATNMFENANAALVPSSSDQSNEGAASTGLPPRDGVGIETALPIPGMGPWPDGGDMVNLGISEEQQLPMFKGRPTEYVNRFEVDMLLEDYRLWITNSPLSEFAIFPDLAKALAAKQLVLTNWDPALPPPGYKNHLYQIGTRKRWLFLRGIWTGTFKMRPLTDDEKKLSSPPVCIYTDGTTLSAAQCELFGKNKKSGPVRLVPVAEDEPTTKKRGRSAKPDDEQAESELDGSENGGGKNTRTTRATAAGPLQKKLKAASDATEHTRQRQVIPWDPVRAMKAGADDRPFFFGWTRVRSDWSDVYGPYSADNEATAELKERTDFFCWLEYEDKSTLSSDLSAVYDRFRQYCKVNRIA